MDTDLGELDVYVPLRSHIVNSDSLCLSLSLVRKFFILSLCQLLMTFIPFSPARETEKLMLVNTQKCQLKSRRGLFVSE